MKIYLPLFIILLNFSLMAQESRFFVPKEVRDAYANGTRSTDGTPGENYWQNEVDYVINASLDPATRNISGTVLATYHNNSPNSINTLVVRLYHDVFKKSNKRLMKVEEEDINDGVEISKVALNGNMLDLTTQQVRRVGTNMFISLPEPLVSGAQVTLETTWSYTVPKTLRRTGVYDSTSYHVAYWYPQFAVYDDVFGWDTFDYTFQTEMYNNLGNFDVTITAPAEFNIWATGMLQNPEEVFPDGILERFNQAKSSNDVVSILTDEEHSAGYANKSGTWHYKAERVSDFAFSVSDHYNWDAAIQRVEDRDVLVSTVYPTGQTEAYADVTTNQQKAMKHFSEDMPGIPYPYPAFTTFIGLRGGGMEFPMMANNAGPGLGVTVHEMYHTYFPMYVRVNERRFAWMDEGWAQYITKLVTERYFSEDNQAETFEGLLSGGAPMGTFEDLPLITSSQFMDGSNYGYASYSLPAFFYGTLHHYLGEETFTKAYREYIKRWAEKSPTPYDFIYTMEDVSGQDLAWLFNPWFFNYGNADLALGEMKDGNLTVNKIGTRPVPLKVDVFYSDGNTEEIIHSAKVWKDASSFMVKVENPGDVDYILLSQGVPDEDASNNLFPSMEEIYTKRTINPAISGEYPLDQYPVSMVVEEKDGIYYLSIPQAGMSASALLPLSNTSFRASNGAMSVDFNEEDGTVTGATLKVQGMNFTAKKK